MSDRVQNTFCCCLKNKFYKNVINKLNERLEPAK